MKNINTHLTTSNKTYSILSTLLFQLGLVLLFSFFSGNLMAQKSTITVNGTTYNLNGDPSHWVTIMESNDPSIVAKSFRRDANKSADDQWTGGSADPDLVNNWTWVSGSTNDKGDISNAGVIMQGRTIYFFGDRTAINGDAQIAFWFFLGGITEGTAKQKGGFNFNGENADGDILAISNFINGGGTPSLTVYKRNADGSLGSDPAPKTFLAVNQITYNAPNTTNDNNWPFAEDWTFTPKSGTNQTYPSPLFFEGSIDFTNVSDAKLCFTNFLLETRNSQSLTASLQDFVSGAFSVAPPQPVVSITESTLCGTETAPSLTVNCPVAATYKLTQTGETPITKVYPTNAVNGVLKFTGLKDGKGFEIFANTNGCLSDTTDCTNYTSLSCPTGVAIARQSASIETATIQMSTDLKIKATPNPYNNRIRFTLEAPMTGDGSLELYNMLGQKVKTVYSGHFEKGQVQTIEYKVPAAQRSNLVYVFSVGTQKTSGKLVGIK